jgi:hypothetical protein
MFDPTKLLALVSTKAATGIAVATLAVGGTGATVLVVSHTSGGDATSSTVSTTDTTTTTADTTTTSTTTTADSSTGASSASGSSTTNHGDVVTSAVTACKSSLSASLTATSGSTTGDQSHGIGRCVSQVASSKGHTESSSHAHSGTATTNGHSGH